MLFVAVLRKVDAVYVADGRNMQLSPLHPVTLAGAPAGLGLHGGRRSQGVRSSGSAKVVASGVNFGSAIQARSGIALTSHVPVVLVPVGFGKGWGLRALPFASFSEVVGHRQSGSVLSLPEFPVMSPHWGKASIDPDVSSRNMTLKARPAA